MGIKVSIVLPTYNVEKYLCKCVESIINQTLKDIEIIIVNDGSTDKSRKIAEKLSTIDSRIIVINQENLGLSEARNSGLKIARGDYIAFIDSDDWVEQDMFLKMYKLATVNDCDIVQCNYNITNNNYIKNVNVKIPTNKLLSREEINKYIKTPLIEGKLSTYAWDKLYKVSFLKKNDLYFRNIPRFEDWYFIMAAISKMDKFIITKDNFYNYRVNEGSLSRRYYENYIDLVVDLHKKKYRYMKQWDMKQDIYIEKSIKNLGDDILNLISYIYNPQYKLSEQKTIKMLENLIDNEFLKKNFYDYQFKLYIKNSQINKIHLNIIFYGLKYKQIKLINLIKKYI